MRSQTSTIRLSAGQRFGVVDCTDDLRRAVKDAGITNGCAVAYCQHTTAALVINEWEDGVHHDLARRLDVLIPSDEYYAHDDMDRRTQNIEDEHERPNGRAHLAQMLVGATSHAIPVSGGEPMLGRWQRLIFVELDDPRERDVLFHVFGD